MICLDQSLKPTILQRILTKKEGMEILKLGIREQAVKSGHSELIINSFIESCIKLETNLLEPLFNEEQYFENKNKWEFLAFLKKQFDFAKAKGLERTIVRHGICGFCKIGHRTNEFIEEDGKIRFAYIIEQKDGEIKDIYNCNASSGWNSKLDL